MKIMFLTRRYHVILWMHCTLASGSASSICYHLKFENSIKLPSTWWPFFMEEMHIYILYLSKSKTLSGLQTPHNFSEWFHQGWLVSGGITLYHFFYPINKVWNTGFLVSAMKCTLKLVRKCSEHNMRIIKTCPWWPFSFFYH